MTPVAAALPAPWGLILTVGAACVAGTVAFLAWHRKITKETVQSELAPVLALIPSLTSAIKSLEDTRNAQTSFFAQQGVLMEKAHAISMEALKAAEATQGYAASLQAQMETIRRDLGHRRANGSAAGYSDP